MLRLGRRAPELVNQLSSSGATVLRPSLVQVRKLSTDDQYAGYVNIDAEEEAIEEQRPLNPLFQMPVKPSDAEAYQQQRAAQLKFLHMVTRNRKLAAKLTPILQDIREKRSRAFRQRNKERRIQSIIDDINQHPENKLIDATEFNIENTTQPADQQVRLEQAFLERSYTKMAELHLNNPDASPNILAQHMPEWSSYEFPEIRDEPHLRAMLKDFFTHPRHILRYQAKLTPKQREKFGNVLLNPMMYAFSRHRAVVRAIVDARKMLLDSGFQESELQLPKSLPDLSATSLYGAIDMAEEWVAPGQNDHIAEMLHIDEIQDRKVEERREERVSMSDKHDEEHFEDRIELNKHALASLGIFDEEEVAQDKVPNHEDDEPEDEQATTELDLKRNRRAGGEEGEWDDEENVDGENAGGDGDGDDDGFAGEDDEDGDIYNFSSDDEDETSTALGSLWEASKAGVMERPLEMTPDQKYTMMNDIDKLERLGQQDDSLSTASLKTIKDPQLRLAVKRAFAAVSLEDFDARVEAFEISKLPELATAVLQDLRDRLVAVEELKNPNIKPVDRLLALLRRDSNGFTDFPLAEECLRGASEGHPDYEMSTELQNLVHSWTQSIAALQEASLDIQGHLPNDKLATILRNCVSTETPLSESTQHISALHNFTNAMLENEYSNSVRGLLDLGYQSSLKIDQLTPGLQKYRDLPPLLDQFPNGTYQAMDETFGDNNVLEVDSFKDVFDDVIAKSIDVREHEIDRYVYEGMKAFKQNEPRVGEALVYRPTRQRLTAILRSSFDLFNEGDMLFDEDTAVTGLIYDIGRGFQRTPKAIQADLDAAGKDWFDEHENHAVHVISEFCHRLFTTPASLGIMRTSEGQELLERSAHYQFVQKMVDDAHQRLVDSDTPLARRTVRALSFIKAIGAQMPKPEDQRLIQVMELLHIHLYQVAVHNTHITSSPPSAYPPEVSHVAAFRLHEDGYEAYLQLIEDWIEAQAAVSLYMVPGETGTPPPRANARLQDFGVSYTTAEYVEPFGSKLQQKRTKFASRKVKIVIYVPSFHLPERAHKRFVELAGPRYDPVQKTLRVVADKFPNSTLNRRHAEQMIRALMTEAYKAEPNFIAFADLDVSVDQYTLAQTKPLPRNLPPEFSDPAYTRMTLSEIEAIKDPELKWRVKQLHHQWYTYQLVPSKSNRVVQ